MDGLGSQSGRGEHLDVGAVEVGPEAALSIGTLRMGLLICRPHGLRRGLEDMVGLDLWTS
eukprot:2721768-Karenia_brevis.AAC.1